MAFWIETGDNNTDALNCSCFKISPPALFKFIREIQKHTIYNLHIHTSVKSYIFQRVMFTF